MLNASKANHNVSERQIGEQSSIFRTTTESSQTQTTVKTINPEYRYDPEAEDEEEGEKPMRPAPKTMKRTLPHTTPATIKP